MRRLTFPGLSLLAVLLMFVASSAHAQYQLITLDSNQIGKGTQPADPQSVNAWGLARGAGSPWWVADEGSGWSTLYNGTGVKQGLEVEVPAGPNGGPIGTPTGIVFNGTGEFQVQGWPTFFLFDALDGTITAWAPAVSLFHAQLVIDNSANKAVYTALAITSKPKENFLFTADTANNRVDIYDGTFTWKGSFAPDAAIPANFTVFGIRDIGGKVFVAFADAAGGAGGFVDVYNESGVLLKSGFIHGAPLNQPWGFAMAPANFGPLSNTLLVSNNTNDGTINGFNATTGAFVGTVKNTSGAVIRIDQLWAIDFGGGTANNGPANTLYFTAGPSNNLAGQFGEIVLK